MNLDPNVYRQMNSLQTKHAEESIANMLEDEGQKNFNLILDLGCGIGNVTELLNGKFPNSKIIAIDLDPKLIEYAKTTHPGNGNISYMCIDISEKFQDFPLLLQKMKGQFGLIFSNYTLHWFPDADLRSAANLNLLLNPIYGRFVCNYIYMLDVLKSPELLLKYGEMNLLNSKVEEQIQRWKSPLEKSGMRVKVNVSEKMFPAENDEIKMQVAKIVARIYLRNIPKQNLETMDIKDKEKLISEIAEMLLSGYVKHRNLDEDGLRIQSGFFIDVITLDAAFTKEERER